MPGRNVNLFVQNWRWTGATVPAPQAEVDVEIHWTNEDGQARQWSGTVTFPNDLQLVPVEWIKEELEDLLLRAARKRLGIDD